MPRQHLTNLARPRTISPVLLITVAAGIWGWWAVFQPGIDARTRARLVRP